MATTHDDLDAIRAIVDALTPFEREEQQRIVRWAFEKLGFSLGSAPPTHPAAAVVPAVPVTTTATITPGPLATPSTNIDIKSFVAAKAPANDMQFAATIAYFYAFEATEVQKKTEIGSDDLLEACRLTGRERLANPGQTLRNAAFNGLMDKGSQRGAYKINTVGENLVALTLPSGSTAAKPKPPGRRANKRAATKKAVTKMPGSPAKRATKKTGAKKEG